ncbi:epimerase, partial [Escherichia coli]|nr:epimerase [Escherichia coli]
MILPPSLATTNPLRYGRGLTALDNLDFGTLHRAIVDCSLMNNITFGM